MKISVVIPTYNREKTIQNTLESVLRQTCLPHEIIVVDDCSTDHTVTLVKKMKQKSKLLRLICLKRNQGAQVARNVGIKAAEGDWIAFLDSDDEWAQNKLELCQNAYCEHPEYDVYFSDYYLKEKNKIRYKKCSMPNREGDYFESILFGSKVLFPTMVVKKQALKSINYLDERVVAYQEWDTNIRLAQNHRYYYINKPLCIYILHDGETISKDYRRAAKGYKYIIINNGDLFLDKGIKGLNHYLVGMYFQYKRCKDVRSYFYWGIERIVKLLSRTIVGEKFVIQYVRGKWKKQRILWANSNKRN